MNKQELLEKIALRRQLFSAINLGAKATRKGIMPITSKAMKAGISLPIAMVGLTGKAIKGFGKGVAREGKSLLTKGDVTPYFDGMILGIGASKAYKSYKNPNGYLGRARTKYLKSRYLPGGLLNTAERNYNRAGHFIDYIRGKSGQNRNF